MSKGNLNGVEVLGGAEAFDSDDGLAVHRTQRRQTRVHRFIAIKIIIIMLVIFRLQRERRDFAGKRRRKFL